MNTNSQNGTATLSPLEAVVLEAFKVHGSMTDHQLVQVTGKSVQTVSPRRRKLADKGYLEEVGKAKTDSGKQATVWGLVPDDRIEEVRAKNKNRKPRTKDIRKLPLEKKLEIMRQLLDDPAVNIATKDLHGRAWSKVRGRVQDRRGQRERERRELNALIREAENKDSPVLEFLKLKRLVKEATETVRGVDDFIDEDLRRRDGGEGMHIAIPQWPEVADALTDLSTIVDSTLGSIRTAMGALGDDVIEGVAIDIEDVYELPGGDSE